MTWFPQWWGWYSTNPNEQCSNAILNESDSATKLEDEILDALGSDSIADSFENNTLLKRDVVFGRFNFTLKQGTFHLCSAIEPKAER